MVVPVVGALVKSSTVGEELGLVLGLELGLELGLPVGELVGDIVGEYVGDTVGESVGDAVSTQSELLVDPTLSVVIPDPQATHSSSVLENPAL